MKSSSVKNQVKCEICNDCMIFGQPISRSRKREFGFDSYNGFYWRRGTEELLDRACKKYSWHGRQNKDVVEKVKQGLKSR